MIDFVRAIDLLMGIGAFLHLNSMAAIFYFVLNFTMWTWVYRRQSKIFESLIDIKLDIVERIGNFSSDLKGLKSKKDLNKVAYSLMEKRNNDMYDRLICYADDAAFIKMIYTNEGIKKPEKKKAFRSRNRKNKHKN